MAYIYPAPGVANVQCTLTLATSVTGDLPVPALQDITVNNANDTFTWSQLDSSSKLQIATTATNSLTATLVLDSEAFFGNATTTTGSAARKGIFGLSRDKDLVEFDLYMGDNSDGSQGKTLSGSGYITGLAPTVSADQPVWTSPVTISITGDISVA